IDHGRNGTSEGIAPSERNGTRSFHGNSLTLKRVERDFLRLLRNVIGDHERGPSHRSAYPLSQMELEDRKYTFAVVVDVPDILSGTLDLDELQIGADCIELVLD